MSSRPKQIAGPVVQLARELAPKPEEIEVYICPGCDEEYEDMRDAQGCCPPDLDPHTRYLCPVCCNRYDNEEEAQECCESVTDPEAKPSKM